MRISEIFNLSILLPQDACNTSVDKLEISSWSSTIQLVVLFCCPVNYSFRTPHRGRPVGGPVLMKLCARNVSVSLHLLLTKYTAMKKYSMSKPCWAGMKVLRSRYTRVSSSLKRCLQCESEPFYLFWRKYT